jgi:DTW domain-containing protein YfiP
MDYINRTKMTESIENKTAPQAPAQDTAQVCQNCLLPLARCFCNKIQTFLPASKVVILQHPREQGRPLNSALLTHKVLKGSTLKVGLSWRNLGTAVNETAANPADWGVLFFKKDDGADQLLEIFDRHKKKVENKNTVKGIIVLDGSWKQVKTLWWRNPWLLKLYRIQCNPQQMSLRKQVKKGYLSTAEAVSFALVNLGEQDNIGNALQDQYRQFIVEQK